MKIMLRFLNKFRLENAIEFHLVFMINSDFTHLLGMILYRKGIFC